MPSKKKTSKKKKTSVKRELLPILSMVLAISSMILVVSVVIFTWKFQQEVYGQFNSVMREVNARINATTMQLDEDEEVAQIEEFELGGPLAFDAGASTVRGTLITFPVSSRFTADTLRDMAAECGTVKDSAYYDQLALQIGNETGYEYIFTYTGESQPPESYSISTFPNVPGYASLEVFKEDFDFCATGGDAYPLSVDSQWLIFESSCGTGFADGSDRPIGCQIAKELVRDVVRVEN